MSRDFQILDAAELADRSVWSACWQQWPGREVFAHPGYVSLYAGPHVRAMCAVASCGGSHALYPFLLRSLAAESYCPDGLRDAFDIVTPYGYGGPFRWGDPWQPEAVCGFWQDFGDWARSARVVSEVVRFSLFPETLLEYPGERHQTLDNVIRSIRTEDELWREFEHKVRKNVNRARASGVTVNIDESGERLDDFLAIYAGTMDRRNAEDTYYFPRPYFESLRTDLAGQCAWFHACVEDKVISTELVLISDSRIYSFLGGTDAAWFHVRPNDLLKVEIMNWARSLGKADFVLGGSPERGDGIFRYKLSFAPNGSTPFSIGSRTMDGNSYVRLIEARQKCAEEQGNPWKPNTGYFPGYRA